MKNKILFFAGPVLMALSFFMPWISRIGDGTVSGLSAFSFISPLAMVILIITVLGFASILFKKRYRQIQIGLGAIAVIMGLVVPRSLFDGFSSKPTFGLYFVAAGGVLLIVSGILNKSDSF